MESLIEALALVGVIAAVALLIYRFVFAGMNLAGAMGVLFTGLPADGWPRGIQEEDRDRPWGRTSGGASTAPDLEPPLTRVHPEVHAR